MNVNFPLSMCYAVFLIQSLQERLLLIFILESEKYAFIAN